MKFMLDYDKMVLLDAEDLAEAGIKNAYQSIAKVLGQFVPEPADVQEIVDNEASRYVVSCGHAAYRFYAINGGNDLGGILLMQDECEAARKSLLRKEDWPYLPTPEHPWYGQNHT